MPVIELTRVGHRRAGDPPFKAAAAADEALRYGDVITVVDMIRRAGEQGLMFVESHLARKLHGGAEAGA